MANGSVHPPLPLIAGRYRLGDTVAAGPLWSLHVADDVESGQRVRLRLISRDLASRDGFADRVRRHTAVVRELSDRCPAVTRIRDAGPTADGGFFLALQPVDGPTLSALVDRHGPFSLDRGLRLAVRIGEVVEAAHNLMLIDGRLGPVAIRVREPGDDVILVDLGLDLALGAPPDTDLMPCLAPEVVSGAATSERTDVYGLGVILYTLLTGRAPNGDPGRGTAHPRTLRAGIPRSVDTAVMRALESDPARRHPDVSVLLNDLSGPLAVASQAGGGGPSDGSRRMGANRWAIGAGAGAVAVLAAAWLAWPGAETTSGRPTRGVEKGTMAAPMGAPAAPTSVPSAAAVAPPDRPATAPPASPASTASPGAVATPSEAPGPARAPILESPAQSPRELARPTAPAAPPRLDRPGSDAPSVVRPAAPRTVPAARELDRPARPLSRIVAPRGEGQLPELPPARGAERDPALRTGAPGATPAETRPSAPRSAPSDTSDDPGAIIDWLLRERR